MHRLVDEGVLSRVLRALYSKGLVVSLGAFLLCLSLGCPLAAGPDYDSNVAIENRTESDLVAWYITPADSSSWGRNQLLISGRIWEVPPGSSHAQPWNQGVYDMAVEDEDGNWYEIADFAATDFFNTWTVGIEHKVAKRVIEGANPEFAGSREDNAGYDDVRRQVAHRNTVVVIDSWRLGLVDDTTEAPYESIGYLQVEFPSGAHSRGTGFLVAPAVVLTSGHCVYSHDEGGWAEVVTFEPGQNGGAIQSQRVEALTGWTESRDSGSDIAAVMLVEEVHAAQPLLLKQTVNADWGQGAGFPAHAYDEVTYDMWSWSFRITDLDQAFLSYVDAGSLGGASGSPIFETLVDGVPAQGTQPPGRAGQLGRVVAVHRGSRNGDKIAVRVSRHWDTISEWMRYEPPSQVLSDPDPEPNQRDPDRTLIEPTRPRPLDGGGVCGVGILTSVFVSLVFLMFLRCSATWQCRA